MRSFTTIIVVGALLFQDGNGLRASKVRTKIPRTGKSTKIMLNDNEVIQVGLCPARTICVAEHEQVQIARSYDGNAWEGTGNVQVKCGRRSCTIDPHPEFLAQSVSRQDNEYAVTLTASEAYFGSNEQENSRFLMQASFGPTRQTVQELGSSEARFEEWIQKQMTITPSLLRQRFRSKVNVPSESVQQPGHPSRACDRYSRWQRAAFNTFDVGKTIITTSKQDHSVLKIDGFDRYHALDGSDWASIPDVSVLCSVTEHSVVLGSECEITLENPQIHFESGIDVNRVIFDANLGDLNPPVAGAQLLKTTPNQCAVTAHGPQFARTTDGRFYLHDPRIVLVENSLQNPNIAVDTPMTFLNEKFCTVSLRRPIQNENKFLLDSQLIRRLYLEANKYVYSISGLEAYKNPCYSASRWKVTTGACEKPTQIGQDTLETLGQHFHESFTNDGNLFLKDIPAAKLVGKSCRKEEALMARINIEYQSITYCFENVHHELYNVYDFSEWTSLYAHPGNIEAFDAGRSNPIKRRALLGETELEFPFWHTSGRWNSRVAYFPFLGRLGDFITFSSLPKAMNTVDVAAVFGTVPSKPLVSLSCGSPGETKSNSHFGARYGMALNSDRDGHNLDWLDEKIHRRSSHITPWSSIMITAKDQLRQRIAWALSKIFVASVRDTGGDGITEQYLAYYDIFVRNAFGSYHDILREVSFSPIMAKMLSFLGSKSSLYSLEESGMVANPDENYAREIMQLFTTGLWQLESNGSRKLDGSRKPIPIYSNEDVMAGARVWTGFDLRPMRSNIEAPQGPRSENLIDPMIIHSERRDRFPKLIFDAYVGDHTPLCQDLVEQMFFRKGAKYKFLLKPTADQVASAVAIDSDSNLFQALCGNGESNIYKCNFKSQVVLEQNLNCAGAECDLRDLQIVHLQSNSGDGVYYKYIHPECTYLAFSGDGIYSSTKKICVPKEKASDEEMAECSVLAKVRHSDKKVSIVHKSNGKEMNVGVSESTENWFRVLWNNDEPFSCSGCENRLNFCLCPTIVERTKVFSSFPRLDDVTSMLHVGAPDPESFETGLYTLIRDRRGVKAFKKQGGRNFDEDTIFEISLNGKVHRFRNIEVTVKLGDSQIGFRNPPSFHHIDTTTEDKAMHETEAVLKQYITQPSTAPFVAHKLIQHLVTSNPSQRYVDVVAKAFATGIYGKFGSGQIGDLSATVAAILLDAEARSMALDADPAFGGHREPITKVIHLMRSMELVTNENLTEIALIDLDPRIGMTPLDSPTVFSFYNPEYQPHELSKTDLVAPESFLLTAPLLVGMMNGLLSLVQFGLSPCNNGLGIRDRASCSEIQNQDNKITQKFANGRLSFVPKASNVADIIDEVDLYLTAGKTDDRSRKIIQDVYTSEISKERRPLTETEAFRVMLQLFIGTPQFHSSNQCVITDKSPLENEVEPDPTPETPKPIQSRFKSVVYLYLGGGADSFNMLVPHSNCGSKDLYAEYAQVRGPTVTIPKQDLLVINSGNNKQPCSKFGLNPSLKTIHNLYNEGDALILANTGNLVEHVDSMDEKSKLPPGLFAHNLQKFSLQTNVPQNSTGDGLMGRTMDDLVTQGYNAATFSTSGTNQFLVGELAPDIVDARRGALPLDPRPMSDLVRPAFEELNQPSTSLFGDMWATMMKKVMARNDDLSNALDAITVDNFCAIESNLMGQFLQISKLIKARQILGGQRYAFYASQGGYDTHNSGREKLELNLAEMDSAVNCFVQELKRQRVWDDTVIVVASEFGRTLSSNGIGTDHGWGGNYMILGGKVKGGQILGEFPDDLTNEGPLSAGRGRVIPTTSWDDIWSPILGWFGIEDFTSILPNLPNFNPFSRNQIFQT